MKGIYLILVAGPQWDTRRDELAAHQQRKMERLIETLLPYRTSSQLLRSSTHMAHHVCAAKISEALHIHDHREDKRFDIDYKFKKRFEYVEKYLAAQTFADCDEHQLVIFVADNTITRDVAEYFDPKSQILRHAECDHCQAVVLEYTDHAFIIKEYLNLGE